MTQIADAPYIREAETLGMPPYENVDLEPAKSSLMEAHYHLGQAIQHLCNAADEVEGTIYEKSIEELIERLEDFQSDISLQKEEMRG